MRPRILQDTASFLRPGCEARGAAPERTKDGAKRPGIARIAHANSPLQAQQVRSGASRSDEERADSCPGRHAAQPLRTDAGRGPRVPARGAARVRMERPQT